MANNAEISEPILEAIRLVAQQSGKDVNSAIGGPWSMGVLFRGWILNFAGIVRSPEKAPDGAWGERMSGCGHDGGTQMIRG
jgi:hypothetical protein